MRTWLINLDDEDYGDVQKAIAARQGLRHPDGSPILPEGGSDVAGAYLAEICRGWLEMREAGNRPPL